MSSFGQVPIKEIWEMLKMCAPGYKPKEYTHSHCIMFNGLTYPSLPKKPQVDKGHIKKMARHLGILECAEKYLSL